MMFLLNRNRSTLRGVTSKGSRSHQFSATLPRMRYIATLCTLLVTQTLAVVCGEGDARVSVYTFGTCFEKFQTACRAGNLAVANKYYQNLYNFVIHPDNRTDSRYTGKQRRIYDLVQMAKKYNQRKQHKQGIKQQASKPVEYLPEDIVPPAPVPIPDYMTEPYRDNSGTGQAPGQVVNQAAVTAAQQLAFAKQHRKQSNLRLIQQEINVQTRIAAFQTQKGVQGVRNADEYIRRLKAQLVKAGENRKKAIKAKHQRDQNAVACQRKVQDLKEHRARCQKDTSVVFQVSKKWWKGTGNQWTRDYELKQKPLQ